jgi:PhnB protein
MSQMILNPYLNFDGNTKEAMDFYHKVLGGDLEIQTFGEAKGSGMDVPPGYEDKVVHARLESEGVLIMASEGMPGRSTNFGDNVSLALGGTDEAKLTKAFNDLAEGGKITMPLEKQFWGDHFGALKDKFGVYWMVNIAGEKSKK